jgi:hypothetical protein
MEIITDRLRQSLPLMSPRFRPRSGDLAENRPALEAVKAIHQSELFGRDRELVVLARDPKTRQNMIRIVSRSNGQIIGQIPSQIALQMANVLAGQMTGARQIRSLASTFALGFSESRRRRSARPPDGSRNRDESALLVASSTHQCGSGKYNRGPSKHCP